MSDVNPSEPRHADATPPRPPLPSGPAQPQPQPQAQPPSQPQPQYAAPPYATQPYAAPYPPYDPAGQGRPAQSAHSPQQPAYVAPYRAPQQPAYGAALEAPAPTVAPALGIVALILAVIALIGAPLVATIASATIAHGVGGQVVTSGTGLDGSDAFWSLLAPVRDQVLIAELSFWIGTALGLWAIVQGIIAIIKRRGRGWGIAAIVVAAIAPFVYGLLVWLTLWIGLFAGLATGIPNQL